jgi:hypothetical protein
MAFSVSDFTSSFSSDVARPNLFDVQIPLPVKLISYLNVGQLLTMRCDTAQLPSVTYNVTEQKIYGPVEKYPRELVYNESTLTFYLSDDMREKIFFDAWMNLINPTSSYDFAYKTDYATNIVVNQYNVTGGISYSVSLNDAFPISVNQLDLDWSNQNAVHKLAVVFAYYTWTNNSPSVLGQSILNAGIGAAIDLGASLLGSAISPGGGSGWDMPSVAQNFMNKTGGSESSGS